MRKETFGFRSGKAKLDFGGVVAGLPRERGGECLVCGHPVLQLGQLLLDDVPVEVAADFERMRLPL